MKRIWISLILLSAALCGHAQEVMDPIANGQTSAARSLGNGTFGADIYNVDLYTGTASVNIPIYGYSAGNVDFNISIGYDARGIKVDQIQSAVGIGWSLNLGGSITREVNGIEDEIVINPDSLSNYPNKYYGSFHNKPLTSGENTPDIFTASFCGKTFKFEFAYETSTQTIERRVYPYDAPAKAFFNYDSEGMLSLYIIDNWGNAFYFDKGDIQDKKVEQDGKQTFVYKAIEKWNLIKVVTRGGYVVKYNYSQVNSIYPLYKNEEVKEVYLDNPGYNLTTGITVSKNQIEWWSGKISYISNIIFPDGVQIDFDYKDTSTALLYMQPLDKIRISQQIGQQQKNTFTYTFKHSYFQTPWNVFSDIEVPYMPAQELRDFYMNKPAYVNKSLDSVFMHTWLGLRLKLNDITIKGPDNASTENYYSFEYNTDHPLPRRFSASKDYYGYFNNKLPENNVALSSLNGLGVIRHAYTNSAGSTIYGVDRTPDLIYMKAGVLKKVINGAGGIISLYYKDHVLANPANAYAGHLPPDTGTTFLPMEGAEANDGLCADYIEVHDGSNDDNTYRLKYEYEDGQRFFRGGYFYSLAPSDYYPKPRIYHGFYVTPMQLVNGANHGYSRVEVKTLDRNNNLLHSIKYHFSNLMLPNGKSNLYMLGTEKHANVPVWDNNGRFPVYMYQYRMGKPIKIESKDNQGNLTSQTEYFYSDSISKLNTASQYRFYTSIQGRTYRTYGPVYDQYFFGIPYLKAKEKQISFTNNGPFVKETDYTYLDGGVLESTKWIDDDGIQNRKKMDYHFFSDHYVPKRTVLSKFIGSTEWIKDCTGTEYTAFGVRATSAYRLFNDGLINSADLAAGIKPVEEYTRYTADNRLLETRNSSTGNFTAYIRDARIDEVVTTVTGARFEEVASTSFEGTFQSGIDSNKGNWDFDETATTYVSPAISNQPMTGHCYYQLTASNSINSTFAIAAGKKMMVSVWATAKPFLVTNPIVPASSQAYSFNQQSQIGNWKLYTAEMTGTGEKVSIVLDPGTGSSSQLDELRMYPFDATIHTVTYEPLLGPGSTCDDLNRINYYEYDGLGRKTVVRDIDRSIISVSKTVVAGPDAN